MKILTDEVFVLDVRDLRDADRIITFLSKEHGKRDGVAKGAKRKHSRYAGQLQPLAKVSLTWVEKPERELVRISGAELIRAPKGLQDDLEGLLLGSYLADQVSTFLQENEPEDLHFRLLGSTLKALEDGVDRDLAARFFETWILRLAGIFPPPAACPGCGRSLEMGGFLPANGEALVCDECAGEGTSAWKVGPAVVAFLLATAHVRLPDLAKSPPPPKVLRRVEEVCGRVRRSFLQQELRSYRVLQETRRQLGDL